MAGIQTAVPELGNGPRDDEFDGDVNDSENSDTVSSSGASLETMSMAICNGCQHCMHSGKFGAEAFV
jgi:hypothetical protein